MMHCSPEHREKKGIPGGRISKGGNNTDTHHSGKREVQRVPEGQPHAERLQGREMLRDREQLRRRN